MGQQGQTTHSTTTRPPTLGDRLDEAMWARDQTCDDVALEVGADAAEVGRWAADRLVPELDRYPALAAYLGVDDAELRRLVLRSQMRKVQRDIRDGIAPESVRP